MPKKDVILNLPGFTIKNIEGYNPMIIDVVYHHKATCIHCDSKQLRKKDSWIRQVRHEMFGLHNTVLRFKAYKFYCPGCKRYFNQRFPGILKYQRATEKCRAQIFHLHTQGMSQKTLAEDFKCGKSTVERWYHQFYLRENQFIQNRQCPRVLGIDEHHFSKKHRFATTFCDLKKHKIFDVVKGKSEQDLKSFLEQLPGKNRVKIVCIDLSSSYRSLIKKYFPNALIVADRFHVIRLINHSFMQVYQQVAPNIRYQRGLLSIFRRKPDNLSSTQINKRDEYFKQYPALKIIYEFKQRLHRLLCIKHRKAKHCKRLIPFFLRMLEQLKQTPFEPLLTLRKTLYSWREEIVRMWRFTKNNGITEGFHRKMKLIQRRAYGFRNFENYRLRVRVLCA